MNSTIELIMHRRSTRNYDPTPLTQAEKDTLLQAAMRAPTAGAMMLYTILEVEEQSLKDQLAETCDHQPFIAKAPFVLLFLADYQRWMDLYEAAGCEARAAELGIAPRKPAEGDLVLAMMDALISAQTAVIAAESLGIGSCYIGDIVENAEIHRQLFNLPRYTFPAALLCFGRPATTPTEGLVARFDQKFIVHKNKYIRFQKDELNDLHLPFGRHSFDSGDFAAGAQNVIQANYIRKFTAAFSVEMTRSAREMIRRWVGE
ncbi:MAG TPA: nitroreductase family protein [Anaerolineales bacterium]|nr:nitroreductase family protein [Anaerolineales bacterium]